MFTDIRFSWRGDATDRELVELTESSGGIPEAGWWDRIRPHSLGWVVARDRDSALIGFVNVAWDGGSHAFLLDTVVHPTVRRQGVGKRLVERAVAMAREAGAEWLHVDFDAELRPFYEACGFRPTEAGLLALRPD